MLASLQIGFIRSLPMIALVGALSSSNFVNAQPASFMGLGFLPGSDWSEAADISGDGSIVVGNSRSMDYATTGAQQVFRWTRSGGMEGLSAPGVYSNAQRISNDGSTVLGYSGPSLSYALWRHQIGLTVFPLSFGDDPTVAGLSADGGIITFSKHMWTEADGLVGSPNGMRISDISSDGSSFLGWDGTFKPPSSDGFVWSRQGGVTEFGPPYPQGLHLTDPHRFSVNGNVVVGQAFNKAGGTQAFGVLRWDAQMGLTNIGLLPNGKNPTSWYQSPVDISENGSIIVGGAGSADAWIWRESQGIKWLHDVLANEYGLTSQTAGWQFSIVTAISNDGRTIVGNGVNPAGVGEAWIAHLGTPVPEPCAKVLAALAILPALSRWHNSRNSMRQRAPC